MYPILGTRVVYLIVGFTRFMVVYSIVGYTRFMVVYPIVGYTRFMVVYPIIGYSKFMMFGVSCSRINRAYFGVVYPLVR